MDILLYILEYILEFTKFFLVYQFILCLPLRKNKMTYIVTAAGIVVMAMSYVVLTDKYKLLAYIIVLCIVSGVAVKEKVYKIIAIAIWITCIIGTIDSITGNILAMFWNYNNNNVEYTLAAMTCSLVTIIFLSILIFRFHRVFDYNKIKMRYYVLFSVIVAANSVALQGLSAIIEEDPNYNSRLSAMILYIIISLGVYIQLFLIIALAVSRNVYREKDELNKKFLKMEEQHYLYLENREKETKKFRHDIRAHMESLQVLCKEKKYDELEKYIRTIEGKIESYGHNIHVNYGIVDAILNQYDKICQEQKIEFTVKGHFPNECKIEAFDICTIFSNLLSNAVRAASVCEEKKIFVDIRYDEVTDSIFVKVDNTHQGEVKYDGAKIITSKSDVENHGFGLENIRECVTSYRGEMKMDVTEECFSIQLMLKNAEPLAQKKNH